MTAGIEPWKIGESQSMPDNPIGPALWQAGYSMEDYLDQMVKNQAFMARRLREVRLTAEDRDWFSGIEDPLHVLVMTENYCGDALMTLPILARMVETSPGMALRAFIRSHEPTLNAYYTARGITHIPVFHFLDFEFKEIGVWVERSRAAHVRMNSWRARHPKIVRLMDKERKTPMEARQIRKALDSRLEAMENWYREELQDATVAEIRAFLAPWRGRAVRPH